MVHPHPPLVTDRITKGALPVLVNSYTAVTTPPFSGIAPKLCEREANSILGLLALSAAAVGMAANKQPIKAMIPNGKSLICRIVIVMWMLIADYLDTVIGSAPEWAVSDGVICDCIVAMPEVNVPALLADRS